MTGMPQSAKRTVEVQLRETLRPSDVEAICAVVADTKMFTAAEVEIAVELVQENLARGEASGYWFTVAELEGAVVGYAAYGPIACTVSSFDLYWIAVHPTQQGRGIGAVLLAATEERIRAAGGSRIYIDTSGRAAYLPTREFYERSGCCRAAELDDFYAPGDPKVIYVKSLKQGGK